MKTPLGRLVLGLSLHALVSASSSNVLSLDQFNFDSSIKSNPAVIVNFCADGPLACKNLAQEYEEAALLLKDKSQSATLATVDCFKEVDLCNKYNVSSYPAIRVFEGPEKMTRYREARKADYIASLAIKKSTPTIWTLERGPETKEFISLNAVTLILRVNPKDEKAIKEFNAIAESVKGRLSFAIELDPSLPKKGLIGPEITMYKSFGWEEFHYMTGTMSKNQVLKFVQESWKTLIPDCNQSNYPTYMEAGLPLAYLFASTRPEREYYRNILNHLVNKHQRLINFVIMDSWEWLGHAQELGLQTFPGFVIHDIPSNQNFVFDTTDKELSVKEIDKFVNEYVAEQRRIASQKPPKHIEL